MKAADKCRWTSVTKMAILHTSLTEADPLVFCYIQTPQHSSILLGVSLFHLNVSERLSIIVLINDKGSNVLYSDRRQFSHLFLASFDVFSDEETNTHPR